MRFQNFGCIKGNGDWELKNGKCKYIWFSDNFCSSSILSEFRPIFNVESRRWDTDNGL
jgi:hypothetical protein